MKYKSWLMFMVEFFVNWRFLVNWKTRLAFQLTKPLKMNRLSERSSFVLLFAFKSSICSNSHANQINSVSCFDAFSFKSWCISFKKWWIFLAPDPVQWWYSFATMYLITNFFSNFLSSKYNYSFPFSTFYRKFSTSSPEANDNSFLYLTKFTQCWIGSNDFSLHNWISLS